MCEAYGKCLLPALAPAKFGGGCVAISGYGPPTDTEFRESGSGSAL